jgi:hypothetical protein
MHLPHSKQKKIPHVTTSLPCLNKLHKTSSNNNKKSSYTPTPKQKKIHVPPLQLHGQTNQRTHNAEKEEQQVKLCTNSTNAIVVASHVANK